MIQKNESKATFYNDPQKTTEVIALLKASKWPHSSHELSKIQDPKKFGKGTGGAGAAGTIARAV
jgi:hypothetical protein